MLPADTEVLNPYRGEAEVARLLPLFYRQYYRDDKPRGLILGINPGRKGAGLTGIPFTDTPALQRCGIETGIETKETSADFVYRLIEAYGGPQVFFRHWFIGAACPLGFVHRNARGNWVNWNYYDDRALWEGLKPFMAEQLKKQAEICGRPERVIVWGRGKNQAHLQQLNADLGLFKEIIALEHPRFIMQYRRRQLGHYLDKYFRVLAAQRPPAA